MVSHLYPQRKRIRVLHGAYANPTAICSVTAVTVDRRPSFQDFDFTAACADLLIERADTVGVPLYAYCFMPDHLHLLLSASAQTSIFHFVRDFKSRSTRLAWQHGQIGKIWQARFYDHLLRTDEDVEWVVDYILNNPVRKEIVGDWRDYPFSGSSVYAL
ncbi:MAG TPA: transposase [Chloroflexota bacterium]|jgi:putative transposase